MCGAGEWGKALAPKPGESDAWDPQNEKAGPTSARHESVNNQTRTECNGPSSVSFRIYNHHGNALLGVPA